MKSEQVRQAVDEIIAGLDKKEFTGEPINWADLACVEANERKDGSWEVMVEEAAPNCTELNAEIKYQLHLRGIDAVVRTEW